MLYLGEERILDFLDGRLATPDEEELLHTLAVSPERRQVLREHLKLREVTKSLAREDRFTVPESLTNELFNRLESIGHTAPIGPEVLLTRAPEFVPLRIAALEATAAAGATAAAETTLSSGWRFGAMSIAMVSLISFILGAGAYYVFGSSLGLRTHSQEIAALKRSHHAVVHRSASTSQFDVAEVQPIAWSSNAIRTKAKLPLPIPPSPVSASSVVEEKPGQDIVPASEITYTAPRNRSYSLAPSPSAYLLNVPTIWHNVEPTPLALDRGTISVRLGTGPSPSSTSSSMSTLNEFRFSWTMWNYVLVSASMGQLNSYERSATLDPKSSQGRYSIITPEGSTPKSSMLIGMEAGFTLVPMGIPVEAMAGIMYSGLDGDYSPFYERASLMVHFEPWKLLTVSGGLEGLIYTHYLSKSITEQQTLNAYYAPGRSAKALTQETCGLVGPALEIGWHF